MDGLTINEAAETTGWSPRMLRYIESAGLIEFPCALSDIAFAKRLASDPELREALDHWYEERPERPEGVTSDDWLRWEQEKHQRLLEPERPPTLTETTAA